MAFVDLERDGAVAWIRLNRPERLNAYGRDLRRDLAAAFEEFDRSDELSVAIIVGNGTSFCAGRDLKEEAESDGPLNAGPPIDDGLNRYHVRETTKPLISAAHGYAIGAGFGLTLGADYRIASEEAQFAYTEIATGVPGPWDLANYQMIPWALASEIALLGRRIPAARLYSIGLINEVVPTGQHEHRAREIADEFLALPQDLLRATKELMLKGRPRPSSEAIALRGEIGSRLKDSVSRTEALKRFARA